MGKPGVENFGTSYYRLVRRNFLVLCFEEFKQVLQSRISQEEFSDECMYHTEHTQLIAALSDLLSVTLLPVTISFSRGH